MTLLEGYIALWRKYPEDEIKVRVARPHVLSPSKDLLNDYKKNLITWELYDFRFREEILSNSKAVAKLKELAELSIEKDVRFLCYEKPPKPCHRFILMEMIADLTNISETEELDG